MKVDLFGLCFAATKGALGELNILGLTEIIFLPQYPASINASIVGKLRFQTGEDGVKELKITIVNMDGKPLCPPVIQTANVQIPAGASSAIVGIIQGIQNLQISSPGQYQIGLIVNQREEASVAIHALQPPQFQKPPMLSGEQGQS